MNGYKGLKKYLLPFIVAFTSVCSLQADLLDSIQSGSQLINDLKDVYRSYVVVHIVADQQELINLYLNENTTEELNDLLDSCIAVCKSLQGKHIVNDTLKGFVENYLVKTEQSYRLMRDKGIDSKEFKDDYENYQEQKEKYFNYLASAYSTNRFVHFTEDQYWQTMNKKNYILSGAYSTYEDLKSRDLKGSLTLLDSIARHTSDFQEHCIYEIELADQYVINRDTLDNAMETAVDMYRSLLEEKVYSIYLFESWLKWRVVYQQNNGLSKSSEISNNTYDQMREEVAGVILKHIAENEKDEMAVNEFLLMASHDIVRRFGSYRYGNQNTLEFHQIFD